MLLSVNSVSVLVRSVSWFKSCWDWAFWKLQIPCCTGSSSTMLGCLLQTSFSGVLPVHMQDRSSQDFSSPFWFCFHRSQHSLGYWVLFGNGWQQQGFTKIHGKWWHQPSTVISYFVQSDKWTPWRSTYESTEAKQTSATVVPMWLVPMINNKTKIYIRQYFAAYYRSVDGTQFLYEGNLMNLCWYSVISIFQFSAL